MNIQLHYFNMILKMANEYIRSLRIDRLRN